MKLSGPSSSTTTDKASGGDGIPAELFQIRRERDRENKRAREKRKEEKEGSQEGRQEEGKRKTKLFNTARN